MSMKFSVHLTGLIISLSLSLYKLRHTILFCYFSPHRSLTSLIFLTTSNLSLSSQMAAFSYQHPPFLLDSVILPNTPIKIPGFLQKGDINTTCFSHYPSEPIHQVPIEAGVPKESYVDNSRHVSDEPSSMVLKWNQDFSSVGIEPKSGDQVTQEKTQMDKKRRSRNAPCLISALSKDASQGEVKKQKKCNSILKDTEKKQLKADKKNEKKVTEGVPTDYIHVRARRGQATDSHSLAERVRREKISVRMKLLQDLVPGCDKVTSKAHMLDEIINYVQSLQNQVEFLSMKLASVHPMFHEYGVDLDAFMKLRSWASPSLSLQVSIPTQPTVSVDDPTTLTTKSNYPIMDSSVVRLVQQGQRPNAFCQNNENPLWGAEDKIQRFINQSGYNNFSSFQ